MQVLELQSIPMYLSHVVFTDLSNIDLPQLRVM